MKIKVIALAALVSAAPAGSTMVYGGVTTFTGKVVAQACTVNTSDKGLTVTLPIVITSSLKDNAATSGLTPFAIRLIGCATGMNNTQNVKAYFEPSSSVDLATHSLKDTATPTKADSIQIQLLNSNGTSATLLGETDNRQDAQSEIIGSDGNATLHYMTQYYATGQPITGDVRAVVHYTIAYE